MRHSRKRQCLRLCAASGDRPPEMCAAITLLCLIRNQINEQNVNYFTPTMLITQKETTEHRLHSSLSLTELRKD